MSADPNTPGDDQDQAETFDETNVTKDGEDIATADMQRDVFDATAMADDAADDDLAAEAEWRDALDPPAVPERGDLDPDEARLEGEGIAAERNDRVGEPRSFVDNAARVADDDIRPADLEGEGLAEGSDRNLDINSLGYDEDGRAVKPDQAQREG